MLSQTWCESNEALPGPAAADGVGGGAGGGTVISVRAVAACQTETGHEGLVITGLASTLKHTLLLVTWGRRKLRSKCHTECPDLGLNPKTFQL